MKITAKQVKELRDKTGAGMMDCKKALTETDGDMEKAVDWLREKGISQAEKKSSRAAAEGVCEVNTEGNKAIMFELNCETDFVAQNDKFVALTKKISDALLASDAKNDEEAFDVEVEGKPMKDLLLESITSLGENISFRRFSVYEKENEEIFGAYIHMGGKIASLVVLKDGDETLAKDIAMHIAAMKPKYLERGEISEDVLERERQVLKNEALNENKEAKKPKPEHIIAKIIEGRLAKNLKEICLVDQPFVKDADVSVGEHVKRNGATIVRFARLAVGEGIDKKDENFADEVMSQINE